MLWGQRWILCNYLPKCNFLHIPVHITQENNRNSVALPLESGYLLVARYVATVLDTSVVLQHRSQVVISALILYSQSLLFRVSLMISFDFQQTDIVLFDEMYAILWLEMCVFEHILSHNTIKYDNYTIIILVYNIMINFGYLLN